MNIWTGGVMLELVIIWTIGIEQVGFSWVFSDLGLFLQIFFNQGEENISAS